MALPVLDGNQSATTLSSVVTGGEHIVAHTVVSLGSTAISNITNAVSGSVVSVSNFPATQTIAGTVTARVDTTSLVDALSAFTNADAPLPISGTVTANPTGTQIIAGTVTANLPALNWNTVKISFAEGSHFDGIYKKGGSGYVNQISGGVPVYLPIDDNFYNGVNPVLTRSTQTGSGVTFSGTRWNFQETLNGEVAFYAATTAADLRLVNEWSDGNGEVSVYITPYSVEPVAITNSVTVGSLPAISGTVTVGNSVTIGSLPTLTPQLPRVTFIDGSGSVTTANSAVTVFASSTTRSYLLVQVTTGSAFVNVGATATTLNGINLTAGQGYAWETTIPQGVVSLISTTTNSAYVAKQA